MSIDLHIHSWHSSDSLVPPGEIVRAALKLRLSAISITDHDTTASLPEAQAAAAEAGGAIEIVPGVELSSAYKPTGEALHVLGFFVDPECRDLVTFMARSRVIERKNFHRVVEGLAERGLEISEEIVRDSFAGDNPGVPWNEPRYSYLYHYLVKAGAVSDGPSARRALQRIIASKHSEIEPYVSYHEAISAVRCAGGPTR